MIRNLRRNIVYTRLLLCLRHVFHEKTPIAQPLWAELLFCQRDYLRHASVKIDYLDERLKNLLEDESKITKKYGEQVLKQVKRRMRALKLAPNLDELWKQRGGGLHFLRRDRKDQLAYHVGGKRRFIFTPNHDPLPLLDDGGINRKEVTCITILAIAKDYH